MYLMFYADVIAPFQCGLFYYESRDGTHSPETMLRDRQPRIWGSFPGIIKGLLPSLKGLNYHCVNV